MNTLRTSLLFAALLPLTAAINEPIRIETGQVTGIAGTNPEVRVFKGIPFAAPPVGDLRWHAPKPAAKWDGVKAADKFSPTCMQGRGNANDGKVAVRAMSEDCLYLNIYTTAKAANDKRPVMVWIHGGSLTSGAGSIYNGEELAKKGVVVVTVNYRLGTFGFFAHPELTKESDRNASGDYGLLDQVAALEWVHNNIAQFGGDVRRVTIFGESAGSWSVNFMMATPLTRGLFQRVIGESGGEFQPFQSLATAEQAGVRLGEGQKAPTLAALRSKSADDLQKAGGGARPNVDGYLLPEDVYSIFSKGKQNDVPIIVGSNSDEGTMFTNNVTGASFRQQSERRYGADAEAYLKLYPFTNDAEAWDAQAASMRDQTFGWQMRTWARNQNKTGKSKSYMYYFSRVPPGNNRAKGAYHSSEIAYVFNNTQETNRPWTDLDRKLGDTMSSYWVNFATTGDPNGKGLVKWPVYQAKADMLMGFGDKTEVIPVPHKAALDFLDAYYEKLRKSPEVGRVP